MEMIKTFRPDFYTALSDDDLHPDSSKKRVNKAKERSFKFLDECLELRKSMNVEHIEMGVLIGGGFNNLERQNFLEQFAAKKFVDCSAVQFCFHRYGMEATTMSGIEMSEIIGKSVDLIPPEKLRISYGAFQPHTILHLVKSGIDVFDDSYVTIVSELHRALMFSFDLNQQGVEQPEIELMNEKFAEDFSPISETCECFACAQKYTKAYIHHLLKTHEILGRQLIQVHNFHHYRKYFEHIQDALRKNQLDALMNLLETQYSGKFLETLTYTTDKALKNQGKLP